jgi:hypothetical protein
MPLYEFNCLLCDHRFEELVMPKDGTTLIAQVSAIEESPCPNPVCNSTRVTLCLSMFSRRGATPGGACNPGSS